MKTVFILLILSLSFIPSTLFAKIQTRYLAVVGVGNTKSEAIRNGLIEAIKQTNGVKINSKRRYYKAIKKIGVSAGVDSRHRVFVAENTQKLIRETASGFVRNYSILDTFRQGGIWHVRLRIRFKRYKEPGFNPNKRRRIAIIPFEYKNRYIVLNQNKSGRAIANRFTQSLVSRITQSRKFTVLDRENNRYYNQEKKFILSGNSGNDELLKLGRRLGADDLLTGTILNFSLNNIVEHNSIGLPEISKLICNVTISYRILMMSTQQIKWSETISKEFAVKENSDQNSAEAIVASSMNKISGFILSNILSDIYPPKVIAVTRSSIIVNQGGNSITMGTSFKVYRNGQRLTDPYTHEFLGYEEIQAGEIKIMKVDPKVSYAKVINGVVSQGMVLRKVKNVTQKFHSEGEAKTDVEILPNGRVVLPFD